MFFLGNVAALSPKLTYSMLNQNLASASIDHDSDSSELHQFMRKKGTNGGSYGRAGPLFCTHHLLMLVCAALAISLTAGGIGFQIGRVSTESSSNIHIEKEGSKFYLTHGGPIKTRLYTNDSFTGKPFSKETNAAWLSLFPPGAGLIQHPEVAPNISEIAMFHELHCLNNVRNGYYHLLLDPHNNETPQNPISRRNDERRAQQSDIEPGHIAHCLEYLRQTLMCVADTNIEKIDLDAGGVTGWGVERRCGDYDKVRQWATNWGIKTVKASHHHPHRRDD